MTQEIQFPPRIPLCFLPTPLAPLSRMYSALGVSERSFPQLSVKRDDLTGLALGGNKVRKLEFLLAAAQARGADTLLTVGAPQSNHCRQTAAAAAVAGLQCALLLLGEPQPDATGNVLLDSLFGARLHWTEWHKRDETLDSLEVQLTAEGRRVYRVPFGGSSPLGALGYAIMMYELAEQLGPALNGVSCIVFPSGSGGTQAGVLLGARLVGYRGQILGISVLKPAEEADAYATHIASLAAAAAQLLGSSEQFSASDVEVSYDFLGGGYGVLGSLERNAVQHAAQLEGILLDPVYTGRAFGGLLSLIQNGRFSENDSIIFLHTGGAPAVFAYGAALL